MLTHTCAVSALTHTKRLLPQKNTLAFTHTSLVGAHEGRGSGNVAVRAAKGISWYSSAALHWLSVQIWGAGWGEALFLRLLAICDVLGFLQGIQGML